MIIASGRDIFDSQSAGVVERRFLLFLKVSLHLLSCFLLQQFPFRAAMAFNDDYEVGMEAELIHEPMEEAGIEEGFVPCST